MLRFVHLLARALLVAIVGMSGAATAAPGGLGAVAFGKPSGLVLTHGGGGGHWGGGGGGHCCSMLPCGPPGSRNWLRVPFVTPGEGGGSVWRGSPRPGPGRPTRPGVAVVDRTGVRTTVGVHRQGTTRVIHTPQRGANGCRRLSLTSGATTSDERRQAKDRMRTHER